MKWKIRYRKQAYKFITEKKINGLVESKILSYLKGNIADVKKLKGNWKNHLRLRIGKIRVIFSIDKSQKIIDIKKADYRGDIYN